MIGISLPLSKWEVVAPMLAVLSEQNVKRIELQDAESAPHLLVSAIGTMQAHGIDPLIRVGRGSFEETLSVMEIAAEAAKQESLPVILSADWLEDLAAVQALTETVRERMLPVVPALDCTDEMDVSALMDRLKVCGLKHNMGLCLSLGGQYDANDKRMKGHLILVRVQDTDIPQMMFDAAVRARLSDLSFGFLGSYYLQVTDGTLPKLSDLISDLVGAMPLCARLYDDIRANFDERFRHALTVWDQPDRGTYFALIHSTAFLFQTNGYRWAMDVAFRNTYRLAKMPHEAPSLLKDLELMIISHEHGDHFEEQTVRRLAPNRARWIIPEFLVEMALSRGLSREQIIVAHAGEPIHIGPLTVLPFEGRHFRPVTGKGVPSYGYHISAPDAPSLVFPGDTRNFSLEGLVPLPEADWCFANVWLGDKSGYSDNYGDLLTNYAKYMLHFSDRNVIFAHLYECNRRAEDMWRRAHANLISKTMQSIVPDVKTYIPSSGEVMHLL